MIVRLHVAIMNLSRPMSPSLVECPQFIVKIRIH